MSVIAAADFRDAIEPQRDYLLGTPQGADGSTWFEFCEEERATQWSVFDLGCGSPDPALVEDYPSRADAEAAVAILNAGGEPARLLIAAAVVA